MDDDDSQESYSFENIVETFAEVKYTRNKERILLLIPSGGWEFFISKNNIKLNLNIEESIYVEDNGQVKKSSQFIINGQTSNSGAQIEWCLSKTHL